MLFRSSTFYDAPPVTMAPSEVLIRISAICDEFECYGYRRLGAALRHQGVVVNSKKLRRLMRENDLQPKRRRRYVVTTDSEGGASREATLVRCGLSARIISRRAARKAVSLMRPFGQRTCAVDMAPASPSSAVHAGRYPGTRLAADPVYKVARRGALPCSTPEMVARSE